jgi:hypothetical protein
VKLCVKGAYPKYLAEWYAQFFGDLLKYIFRQVAVNVLGFLKYRD